MLALDRPYISTSAESAIEACDELCLEYGSATLLYMVPFIQNEEKVSRDLLSILGIVVFTKHN